MNIKKLLKKLPYPVKQRIKRIYGLIPLSVRYDKVFRDMYKFLQESQWWSKEKLEDYQMQQLEKLLKHAYKNVPYYRRIFNERGLKPEDIKSIEDLKKVPYLKKSDFKKNFKDFLAVNKNLSSLTKVNTSGTSGSPIQFYWDFYEYQKEWAFVCHQWNRVGYSPGDPRIELRGPLIEGNKLFDYNLITKVLRLSPRIDNKEVAEFYLDKINSCGAKFLHGYPSIIGHFAVLIKQFNLAIKFKLKAVLFASESIYPWQRKIVEEIFRCRTFGFYGMSEHVVIAGECENNANYHCVPQYGITEMDPVTNEIIGTSFLNYVNPFIRYKTTDIASKPIMFSCNECKRKYYPVFSRVEGRLEDYIITPEGSYISPAVITHPFKKIKTIKNTQIIQKSLDYIKVNVVPWNDCASDLLQSELLDLCQGLRNILGSNMKIVTNIVDSIQLSKSGKFKWIISDVSKDLLQTGKK